MVENKITLKTVGELLGMKFIIPDYQRGYRWTKQQVNDLLNDLDEFRKKLEESRKEEQNSANNINKNEIDDFYCLQPLVVKECIEDKQKFLDSLPKNIDDDILKITRQAIADATKWEVIDGQQRLTTIYLILFYLKNYQQIDKDLYSISYQTKEGFDFFVEEVFNDINEEHFDDFVKKLKSQNIIDNIDFYHVFQTIRAIDEWFKDKGNAFQASFAEKLIHKVRFIWYESVDENPIRVFTRLNIGRISLTNAELIKALFLNRSNFIFRDNEHLKLRQQEIASEWDKIEYTLQNDEFWLFLNNEDYDRPTRIDFIFDLICENKSLGSFNQIGTDNYKTFRYFYEYFKLKNSNIESCWKEVKRYYQAFKEWYNDLELYHYVGYLISNGEKLIFFDLLKNWFDKQNKVSFVIYLKEQIKNKVKACNDLNQQYEIGGSPSKTECKPVLLLHNIKTIIDQNEALTTKEEYKLPVFYKFPFHLYKREKWDVEHIDSNTTNGLENKKDQIEWLKYALLDQRINSQKLRTRISAFIKGDNQDFSSLVNEIETAKNGNEAWDDASTDKNKIWNFVLLDAGTNRGYGNSIFPAKRRIIIGKDQGIRYVIDDALNIVRQEGGIAFIPPVTKNVFMKYYSISEVNFQSWTREDARQYKENIKETLSEFGVIDSSEN
jgi:hypothetical protein